MLRAGADFARALRCMTLWYSWLGAATPSLSHFRVLDPAPIDRCRSCRDAVPNVGSPEHLLLGLGETSPAMLCLNRTVSRAPE